MKRKESHWEHEEEITPDKRKTTKKQKTKNCNAVTKFLNLVNAMFL